MTGRNLLIFLIAISLGGCMEDSPPKPKNLIQEDTYIDLLVELQLLRSYGDITNADSLTVDSLTSEVFKRYKISDKVFRTSHNYYQQFPKQQQNRIEEAIERLKMDQISNNTKDTVSKD
jgi:hypothetical protein